MSNTSSESQDGETRTFWKKNLIALWFGMFMTGMGFSVMMPFLSLFIAELGDFTHSELSLYSGLAFAASYIVTAIVSPIWGSLADRYGRKVMLLRASFGMGICILLMGLTPNVWILIILRLVQGVFSGYMSNSNALLATQVPKKESGKALGTLATGSVSGTLLGPFIGGILASVAGYQITFFITGGLLLSVFFVTLIFVKENFEPISKEDNLSTKEVINILPNYKLVFGMFITTMIIQASNTSITPILSLYVKQILNNSPQVSFYAGIVAAIPGLATLFAAPRLGALGDRIGTHRIIMAGFIFAICLYVPMAFVTNIWQLLILRFLIGISNACMLPAVQTILAKNTPSDVTGRVFSWNQSLQAFGNFLGPIIGSVVSSIFGYAGVFISTSILVLLNLILIRQQTKRM